MLGGIDVGFKNLNTWDNGAAKNNLSGGMMDKTGQSQVKAKEIYDKSIEQLASGLKINKAADDAAGLSITEKLKSMIKGSSMAMKSIGDGLSAIGTAAAGIEASTGNLQAMRELAVQASSDTLSDTERVALNDKLSALKANIDSNAGSASFNGKKLLDGSAGTLSITTNADGGSADLDFSGDFSSGGLGLGSTSVGTKADAENAIVEIDAALETLSTASSDLGASENSLQGYSDRLSVSVERMEEAKSKIEDTDYAKTSSLAIQGYIQQMMNAGLAGSSKTMNPTNVLSFLPSSGKVALA